MATKRCSRCSLEKDTSEFPHDRANKDGLYSWCRECSRKSHRESYRKYQEARRQYAREYYDAHKDESAIYSAKWRAEHPEQKKAMDKAYVQTEVGREAARQAYQRYYERHREAIAVRGAAYYSSDRGKEVLAVYEQSDKGHDKNAKYRQSLKGKAASLRGSAVRRAYLAEGDPVTAEMLEGLLDQYDSCAYCRHPFEPAGPFLLTWDHVFPLARGGRHESSNLRPVCRRCNFDKRTQTLDEWRNRWYETKDEVG